MPQQQLAVLTAELESVLKDASQPVARLVVVQEKVAEHTPHPGLAALVQALSEVADVLVRFDLPAVADSSSGGYGPPVKRRRVTEQFDTAFDDALGKVHAMRREVARVSLAAAARGSNLGPHVIQLRRELNGLQKHVDRSRHLLDELGATLATPAGRNTFARATSLARRAQTVGDLHQCGLQAIDGMRVCEETFAALIVRLKREMGPTYVEWKRLLAPVAMRAFAAEPTEMELPEAREVHALLQRQVQVACDAACAFETAHRQLEETVSQLGRRARMAMETLAKPD
ncbi:hypothetical protein [Ramlibacter albus]|uniref:Uncharacterized protein n=1 Tax=Ramlibacter albus TaxID=2079448 RepID=A0A923MA15_9BURK|nr:hypothetical protein [Ramlibacter albus]MBC5766411.1 hypothetical protein [Ramlibacter albus]